MVGTVEQGAAGKTNLEVGEEDEWRCVWLARRTKNFLYSPRSLFQARFWIRDFR